MILQISTCSNTGYSVNGYQMFPVKDKVNINFTGITAITIQSKNYKK